MSQSLTIVKDGGLKVFLLDIDPIARQMATLRMMELTARFPQQFATITWKACFTFLPSTYN
jgi:hypothetical protein